MGGYTTFSQSEVVFRACMPSPFLPDVSCRDSAKPYGWDGCSKASRGNIWWVVSGFAQDGHEAQSEFNMRYRRFAGEAEKGTEPYTSISMILLVRLDRSQSENMVMRSDDLE